MLQSPYGKENSAKPHNIHCRVSAADYAYIIKLFPFYTGLQDKLLSTLFHYVITELRLAGLTVPESTAWERDSLAYRTLDEIVERILGGRVAGCAGARDDTNATGGVCETMQPSSAVGTDTARGYGKGVEGIGSQEDKLFTEAVEKLRLQKQRRLGNTVA